MSLIDPLVTASLMILSGFGMPEADLKFRQIQQVKVSPKKICDAPMTKINVVPRTEKVKYDYSKSVAELQSKDMDTINPYGYGAVTHTNGYMQGQIEIKSSVKLGHKDLPQYDGNCLWYDTVKIEISIDPTIVIAKEVAADKCMLKAVKTHELKHVMVDRKVVNKYAKRIGKKIYEGLKERGFVVAQIRTAYVQDTAKRMRETVGQLLELEYKKLEIERAERQQKVDSLEEYESVQAKCPNYVSPILQ